MKFVIRAQQAAPLPKTQETRLEMTENLEHLTERLIELETRLVFQDQTIEELHEVIYRQQGQLDELAREMTRLKTRLGEALPEGKAGSGG